MAGMMDKLRRKVAGALPGYQAASDALNSAGKAASDAQYAADEKKYGPRIAEEERRKRALSATSRAVKAK